MKITIVNFVIIINEFCDKSFLSQSNLNSHKLLISSYANYFMWRVWENICEFEQFEEIQETWDLKNFSSAEINVECWWN